MKRLFYLILENENDLAFHVFETIKSKGFNGSIVSTESVKHIVDELPEDNHFFNLRQYENRTIKKEGLMCMFVVDEDKIDALKQIVRDNTNNFKTVKGGMFSKKIDDFEGSF